LFLIHLPNHLSLIIMGSEWESILNSDERVRYSEQGFDRNSGLESTHDGVGIAWMACSVRCFSLFHLMHNGIRR
jgi:tetrahydromethanopterin S-methyltransferase subunit F